jgi:hypothetical protein
MGAGGAERAVALVVRVRQRRCAACTVPAELDSEQPVARGIGEADSGPRQSDQERLQDDHIDDEAAHRLPPNSSRVLRPRQQEIL